MEHSFAPPSCWRPYAKALERAVYARQGRVIRRWYFRARTAGNTLKFVVSAKHDSSATITVIGPRRERSDGHWHGCRLVTSFVRDDGPQAALARH